MGLGADGVLPVLGACLLASVVGQALSYRRSSGERRLQLKWLLGGTAIAAAGSLIVIVVDMAAVQAGAS